MVRSSPLLQVRTSAQSECFVTTAGVPAPPHQVSSIAGISDCVLAKNLVQRIKATKEAVAMGSSSRAFGAGRDCTIC